MQYILAMKTLTVRLPDALAAEIEAESRLRKLSKSDVVREGLQMASRAGVFADLVGSVEGLPPDLSSRKKAHLKATGYGGERPR
jgi:hypothetical protein